MRQNAVYLFLEKRKREKVQQVKKGKEVQLFCE